MKKYMVVLAMCGSMAVSGQCIICTKTAADRGEKEAVGLNRGIVYLAMLPLGILGTLGYIWWRGKGHQS